MWRGVRGLRYWFGAPFLQWFGGAGDVVVEAIGGDAAGEVYFSLRTREHFGYFLPLPASFP